MSDNYPAALPVVQELNEGLFSLVWPGEVMGPYPSPDAAIDEAPPVLVCDEDWERVEGVYDPAAPGANAGCEDYCHVPLDHQGICDEDTEHDEVTCQLCGQDGRLHEVELAGVLAYLGEG